MEREKPALREHSAYRNGGYAITSGGMRVIDPDGIMHGINLINSTDGSTFCRKTFRWPDVSSHPTDDFVGTEGPFNAPINCLECLACAINAPMSR